MQLEEIQGAVCVKYRYRARACSDPSISRIADELMALFSAKANRMGLGLAVEAKVAKLTADIVGRKNKWNKREKIR